ncbi:MAG TPA: YezD family protein [Dehalococcoidia bacterium]|nr:YezD family protein [Dehalococcoidia bacterium]
MNGAARSAAQDLGAATPEELRVLREVLAAIRAVQHGTVSLILQDRRVVQIDRTEKRRLVS